MHRVDFFMRFYFISFLMLLFVDAVSGRLIYICASLLSSLLIFILLLIILLLIVSYYFLLSSEYIDLIYSLVSLSLLFAFIGKAGAPMSISSCTLFFPCSYFSHVLVTILIHLLEFFETHVWCTPSATMIRHFSLIHTCADMP